MAIDFSYCVVVSTFVIDLNDHQDCGKCSTKVVAAFPVIENCISADEFIMSLADMLSVKIKKSDYRRSYGNFGSYEIVGHKANRIPELIRDEWFDNLHKNGLDYGERIISGWRIDNIRAYYDKNEES